MEHEGRVRVRLCVAIRIHTHMHARTHIQVSKRLKISSHHHHHHPSSGSSPRTQSSADINSITSGEAINSTSTRVQTFTRSYLQLSVNEKKWWQLQQKLGSSCSCNRCNISQLSIQWLCVCVCERVLVWPLIMWVGLFAEVRVQLYLEHERFLMDFKGLLAGWFWG